MSESLQTLAQRVVERNREKESARTESPDTSRTGVRTDPRSRPLSGRPGARGSDSRTAALDRRIEAALDEAEARVAHTYHEAGFPRDWITPEVEATWNDLDRLWRAARAAPRFEVDFYRYLEEWEHLAADAMRQAAEETT